jgi:suppressor for copper-sensitivity B
MTRPGNCIRSPREIHLNRPRLTSVLVLLQGLIAAVGTASAQESPWVRSDFGDVRLIAAVRAVGDLQALPVGLEFRTKPGWKVYWRSPGEAGLPPSLDWAGSGNLARASVAWPAPTRFSEYGIESIGYTAQVVLPIRAEPATPGQPLALALHVEYLTCKDICVPLSADLALTLPAGMAEPGPHAQAIDRSGAQVPRTDAAGMTAFGLALERARASGGDGKVQLEFSARARDPFAAPDLFLEGPEEWVFEKPVVALADGGRLARFTIDAHGPKQARLVGRDLTVTLVDGAPGMTRAIERPMTVEAAPPPAVMGMGGGWLAIALLALAGGLVLNLMPCVLPVLSLKLLGAVGHGGGERGAVRRSFLASAAGILFAFLLLAAGTTGLKLAGGAVGWGVQFQEPLFLVALIAILTLFAANLWGWFEVPLPQWIADRALAAGGSGHAHPTLAGHFLTGMFATVLATPCSAPFLGTALGFALAGGPVEIFAVFLLIGLGLAIPYLLVAALPGLATRLPKPGTWMIRLKVVLGLALAGTALWLLSVMAAQVGLIAALAVALAMLALGLALALPRRLIGVARWPAVLAAVAAAFIAPALIDGGPPATASERAGAVAWQPFDEAAIAARVAAGETVLVDVTADWCLTCQVNKQLVLHRGEVAGRLNGGVVAMKADWTRPNPAIQAYLARFGRYGIPFNIVYGPGAPDGIPLPELLTPDAVLQALDKASRRG